MTHPSDRALCLLPTASCSVQAGDWKLDARAWREGEGWAVGVGRLEARGGPWELMEGTGGLKDSGQSRRVGSRLSGH